MDEEKIIIKNILKGDIESFNYFIEKYKNYAFSIIKTICKDNYLSEEIVQESFIITYKNLRTFSFDSKFSTWFYKIVFNHALKKLKVEKKILFTSINEKTEQIEINNWENQFGNIDRKELKKIINEILLQLNEKENLVLNLFYLQEQSIAEISIITQLSISNIKVLLHRARINFKNIFETKYKQYNSKYIKNE